MPGPVFLRGKAVVLRPDEREDAAFIRDNVNDPDVRRLLRNTEPKNRHAVEEEFEEHSGDDGGHGFVVCAEDGKTAEDDPDQPVGHIGVWNLDDVHGTAWMGAWTAPEFRGRGYAPEAAALGLDYAFFERRMYKVRTGVYRPNRPSRRVMEKVGFAKEGVSRSEILIDGERHDSFVYGMLRPEWEELREEWLGNAGVPPEGY